MRPNSAMLFGRISVSMGQPRANLARSPAPVPFPAASVSAAHSPNTETEVNMASVRARKEIAICKRRFLVLFGNGVYFAGMF